MTTYYVDYIPHPEYDKYCTGVHCEIEANNVIEVVNEILARNDGHVKEIVKITSHRIGAANA